jgi:uncharacterized protein (TIGR02271 family)
MTMHADQLMGAPVTDSDGLAVGTIEQVFRDDVDGMPSWARIRSAKGLHFVPLAGSKMASGGGLNVPFDSAKILDEPDINVDRHLSVDQEEQLRQYFGISVPAQPTEATQTTQPTKATHLRGGPAAQDQAETTRDPQRAQPEAGAEWLVRSEERLAVNLETRESGRVTMRKHVDTEPVRQTVRVFHEEYEVERVPIGEDDQLAGDVTEGEQVVVLHEARANVTKETVPIERVRLSVRMVEEDQTVSGEIRRERIEIDDSAGTQESAGGPDGG